MLFGFMAMAIANAAAEAVEEQKAFNRMVDALPPEERQAAINKRADFFSEKQRQREHAEIVEAMKPHTLWSFLGLGRK